MTSSVLKKWAVIGSAMFAVHPIALSHLWLAERETYVLLFWKHNFSQVWWYSCASSRGGRTLCDSAQLGETYPSSEILLKILMCFIYSLLQHWCLLKLAFLLFWILCWLYASYEKKETCFIKTEFSQIFFFTIFGYVTYNGTLCHKWPETYINLHKFSVWY